MKLFYITCLFLFTTGKIFGQVSHATISANIVTPVGAEISAVINKEDLFNNNLRIASPDLNVTNLKIPGQLAFLKIIGEVFSHNTTVENELVILKRKENEEALPVSKHQSIVRITVNFD